MTGIERTAIRADVSREPLRDFGEVHAVPLDRRPSWQPLRSGHQPRVLVAQARIGVVGADQHADDMRTAVDHSVKALYDVVRETTYGVRRANEAMGQTGHHSWEESRPPPAAAEASSACGRWQSLCGSHVGGR